MNDSVSDVAFLFDVDNTLLDNDRVKKDLINASERLLGAQHSGRFWELYEDVRDDYEYVDFPHTLERFTRELPEVPGFPDFADIVLTYPYHTALFEGALDALKLAATVGSVAILSDGDPVFQPAKIARARITAAATGPTLVFAHKEEHVEEIMRRVPSRRYVVIDDKPRIHVAMKERLGDTVTTVQILQGDYASNAIKDGHAPADLVLESISDFLVLDLAPMRRAPDA